MAEVSGWSTLQRSCTISKAASRKSRRVFDVAGKEDEIRQLEKKLMQPDLWSDQLEAQEATRRLASLREEVAEWNGLSKRAGELRELVDLAAEEGDEPFLAEMESEIEQVKADLGRSEFLLVFRGKYDAGPALLAIHAGAGGTDSQEWVERLLRMYLMWAASRGFKTRVLDSSLGEEAGFKSVTAEISGRYAYGYLKAERGVHRLVRLSPFDAAHRRHTSFALVEVLPEIEDTTEVAIDPNDLRIDTFRSSSAGGQHVNKTDSAVRIVHIPTGIVATCQNERSQAQNRAVAMRVLRARLLELQEQERENEQARLKGEHVSAEWGNQIRSYVMHPYSLVKDHRTGHERGNVEAVLNGDIDDFIEVYLRSTIDELGSDEEQ
jgi:peptide chain release factor 2